MNVSVITMPKVKSDALDILSKELPVIISGLLEVPGGNMALVKPEQVSLEFSQASARDVGSDIRIKILASSNEPRLSTKYSLTREILEKVIASFQKVAEDYSVDVRLYLMEIGAAEHPAGI